MSPIRPFWFDRVLFWTVGVGPRWDLLNARDRGLLRVLAGWILLSTQLLAGVLILGLWSFRRFQPTDVAMVESLALLWLTVARHVLPGYMWRKAGAGRPEKLIARRIGQSILAAASSLALTYVLTAIFSQEIRSATGLFTTLLASWLGFAICFTAIEFLASPAYREVVQRSVGELTDQAKDPGDDDNDLEILGVPLADSQTYNRAAKELANGIRDFYLALGPPPSSASAGGGGSWPPDGQRGGRR